jgi:NADH-quinone oxidoreductase chain G
MDGEANVITVRMNGRKLEIPPGTPLLRAARAAGISIPSLCDYELLAPIGACRMCLVEVEGMQRLQTACTLLPVNGMEVTTESSVLTKARRDVLELLLINHPLDCPFCDKSGECDLQDMVLKYGPPIGRYTEEKRHVPSSYDDPLLATNMERCIACERCVRMCEEVQGVSALTMVGRGETTRMEPFSLESFDCEYCGNCLPACPVGAILSTVQMHNYRPWQMDREIETVCGHCGVGCQLIVQSRDESIARIDSKTALGINRGLLCSLGRFGHEYVGVEARLTSPLIKRGDAFVECTWEEATAFVADRLADVKERHGGAAIAGIASPRCTNEENYLFQKFLRIGCDTNNIDSLSRVGFAAAQRVFEDLLGTGVTANELSAIDTCDAILVVGGDPTVINPILGLSVRQAKQGRARIGVVGRAAGLDRFSDVTVVPEFAEEPAVLEALLAGVAAASGPSDKGVAPAMDEFLERIHPAATAHEGFPDLVALLLAATSPAIVVGPELVQRSDGHLALTAVAGLVHVLGAKLYVQAEGANEQGLVDVGCVPDRLPGGVPVSISNQRKRFEEHWSGSIPETPGLSLMEIVEKAGTEIRALYIMGENPGFKLPKSSSVREALGALELLVVQDIFLNETGQLADVVLPAQAWSERDGTYTNIEGRVQRVRKAVGPRSDKADWKILCDVATAMGHAMDYSNVGEITAELARVSPLYVDLKHESLEGRGWLVRRKGEPQALELATLPNVRGERRTVGNGVHLGVERLLFHTGTTSRHAAALLKICPQATAKLGFGLASALEVEEGDRVRLSTSQGSVTVPIEIDPSIGDHGVLLSNHFEGKGALELLDYTLDPVTKAPGLEGCEVSVEKEEVAEE